MTTRIITVLLVWFSFIFPSSAEEISVMMYNLHNYFVAPETEKPKSDESKRALMGMIRTVNPDILFVVELGGEKSLEDLMVNLKSSGCKDYVYVEEMTGEDESRHLGLISKFKPVKVEKKVNLFYKIKPKDKENGYPEKVFVQRGFFHAVFEFKGNYRLHIVGAHLKSRLPHPRYIQTDMRRYEARLLRYLVNDIQKDEPDANILVVGDFNDIYSSDPMLTLRAREKPFDAKLFDLRPLDGAGLPWTHWWNAHDVYGRIDYALASASLLPEIDFERTKVVHVPGFWMFASDHRPVLVAINPENKPSWTEDSVEKKFPDGIRKTYAGDKVEELTVKAGRQGPEKTDRSAAVCFMDAGGFSSSDPAGRKDSIVEDLLKSGAGIIVLTGLKDEQSAVGIRKMLPEHKFLGMVKGADKGSVMAVISMLKPEKFEALSDLKYKIEDTELPVSRGFAHCLFNVGGYKFHLVAADLKDRSQHPEFNQTDMRRYEARQLRYLVNDIQKAEPDANILVVGNLNDSCGMSPLKELYNRRSGIEKRLFDIRPVDSMKTTWTSWNRETDDYERLDYALANFQMIPEIVREKTTVVQSASWRSYPAQRPLVIGISCNEAEKMAKEELDKIYPYSIYSGEAAHFEEDREIGDKPERKGRVDPADE